MAKKQKSSGKSGGNDRVKVSVPADLAKAIESAGDSVENTIERMLRATIGSGGLAGAKGKIAGFFQDIAGPYLPRIEAVAKEVASQVARDVATAAAAAALSTFAAKTGDKPAAKKAPARKPAAKAAAKPAAKKPAAKKAAAKSAEAVPAAAGGAAPWDDE
ncbi:MAG: hypothetical protein Q7J32_02450, partial [Sphingomonadaceae bacterium]|nr:hypothetical protein [Sphingomonadaceae bacterium]